MPTANQFADNRKPDKNWGGGGRNEVEQVNASSDNSEVEATVIAKIKNLV